MRMSEVWENLFSAPFDLDTLIARGERLLIPSRWILRSAARLRAPWSRAQCFCAPASGYRFGVRLSDFTSALSAELYAVFCALKYILRLQVPSAVIFTDSLFSLYHLRDRLSSFRVSPFAYKILHLAALISERGGSVGFAWVPSHAVIVGNELADSVAKSTSGLPFVVHCGVPREDLFLLLERDHQSWCLRLWPFTAPSSSSNRYFDRVSFKTPRPWFSGFRFPRGYISLITRLRSSHVCTGSHFGRMGWDLHVGCGCGAALKSLPHLIRDCPIFSERRPRFFRFLAQRLPGMSPEQVDQDDLNFPPDPEAVGELGRFLCTPEMII